jgi:hypothetical protein
VGSVVLKKKKVWADWVARAIWVKLGKLIGIKILNYLAADLNGIKIFQRFLKPKPKFELYKNLNLWLKDSNQWILRSKQTIIWISNKRF